MRAIYERVSTSGQDVASQHGELEKWAEGKGPSEWFKDAYTGKTMNRPGFTKLLKGIRTGRITELVVWRLDRLGRTASGLHLLFEELQW